MFACRLADQLGMARALVPPHAGVLSALGLAVAPPKIEFSASVHRLATECSEDDLASALASLESQAVAALPRATLRRFADCRYPGQGYELTVEVTAGPEAAARAFHDVHRERYGHADPTRAVEIVNVRIVASRPGLPLVLTAGPGSSSARAGAGHVALDALAPGARVAGPLTIGARDFTLRIERGWEGTVHATGAIVLERT
jgi:N-methylhydantoinase A/oxoprolinase/acetone carboxylase beta subunit